MFAVAAYAVAMWDVRKGRGAASNRSGRYERHQHEAFDDGWGTIDEAQVPLRTEVRPDTSRTVITRIGKCYRRHRANEFLDFLKEIDAQVPEGLDIQRFARSRVRPFHQRLSRLRAWLRLLLRAPDPRLSRPLARPGLREPHLRQARRAGPARARATRARPTPISASRPARTSRAASSRSTMRPPSSSASLPAPAINAG